MDCAGWDPDGFGHDKRSQARRVCVVVGLDFGKKK